MKALLLFTTFFLSANFSYAGINSDTVGCSFGPNRAIHSMTLILSKDEAGKIYAQSYLFTLQKDLDGKYSLLTSGRYPVEQSQDKIVNAQLDLLFDGILYEVRSYIDLNKEEQTVSFDGELFICILNSVD